jgi:hypothetical protein
MERAFFETEPAKGEPVQVVDTPPEGGLPASQWTVRRTDYAWEVGVEQNYSELARQGIPRVFLTAYFTPAYEQYFWTLALFQKPWSDLAREMVSNAELRAYLFPLCPTFSRAFERGQEFARGQLQQTEPFAMFVHPPPEGRFAAVSFEFPTPSIETPPDISDQTTRRVAWGAITFTYEMSVEERNLASALFSPQAPTKDFLDKAKKFVDDAEPYLDVLKLVVDLFSG